MFIIRLIRKHPGLRPSWYANRSFKSFLAAAIATMFGLEATTFADIFDNNGGTNLSSPASWIDQTNPLQTGIAVPGPSDTAQWNSLAGISTTKTFSLSGVASWGAVSINTPGAEVVLDGTYTSTGPITVSSGSDLTFAGTMNARDNTGVMIKTSNLSIAPTSALNLTNHDLMIGNTNLQTVNDEILNGIGAGPGGAQITSWPINFFSTPPFNPNPPPVPTTILIPFDPVALAISPFSWDNVPITDPNSIVVKYTYFGDANLDGFVDSDDFSVIAENFGATTPGAADIQDSWISGDVNLDGEVDGNDFSILSPNIGYSPLIAAAGNVASPSLVPEPASLALLGLGATLLIAKKRHKV